MFLIDSHCHLDALDYTSLHSNLNVVLENARKRGVYHLLSVATTLTGFSALKQLTNNHHNISLSCGIHPLHVDANEDISLLELLAQDDQVVALGETGLDYFYQQDNIAQQQAVFRRHIQVARQLHKPIIVHTRDARSDTLIILKEEGARECGGVLHCFTEDKPTARQLLDLGFYISFSGIVTFRNAHDLREVAGYIPLDRILIETDSPYLAPVPYRGKENQPAYAREIAEYLAVLKNVELESFAKITKDNFNRLFNLSI